jgi:hypothetical protein
VVAEELKKRKEKPVEAVKGVKPSGKPSRVTGPKAKAKNPRPRTK